MSMQRSRNKFYEMKTYHDMTKWECTRHKTAWILRTDRHVCKLQVICWL